MGSARPDPSPLGDEYELSDEAVIYRRLSTLETSSRAGQREDLRTTPLMTLAVKDAAGSNPTGHRRDSGLHIPETIFSQYAVLGFHAGEHHEIREEETILMNVNAPNSTFICGSQGSGKSYTLNCMLENCLIADKRIGRVTAPVAGVAFHYDPDSSGTVAETAYLCSIGIRVNVLVSQSSEHALRTAYSKLPGADKYLTVKPLLFRSSDLSVERMLRLMAFADRDSAVPLYMSVAQRILRQMAISARGEAFDYNAFKTALQAENLTKEQTGPLNLRLELLESYLDLTPGKNKQPSKGLVDLEPGTLTIVDLTDPFMDSSTACILFDTCLSLVKERRPACGLVVALDEAHKYMTSSFAASNFTDRLLGTIREQRHNATRVIIATQEPTISEKLLDLCTVSIIHRFSSPAWYAALHSHLGAASKFGASGPQQNTMFDEIMSLKVGESLVFAPSAFLRLSEAGKAGKLGRATITMKTRARLGSDGGMSILTCMPDGSHVQPSGSIHQAVSALPGLSSLRDDDDHDDSDADTVSSEVVPSQLRQEGVTILPSNGHLHAGQTVAVPDPKKSHLVLICYKCKRIVAVEFSGRNLPNFTNIDQKDLRGGIAHATCVKCKLISVKRSDEALYMYDLVKGKKFLSGKASIDVALQNDLRAHLGGTLGHKITALHRNGYAAYMFLKTVQVAMRGVHSLWEVRFGQDSKNSSRPMLTAYEDDGFFNY